MRYTAPRPKHNYRVRNYSLNFINQIHNMGFHVINIHLLIHFCLPYLH